MPRYSDDAASDVTETPQYTPPDVSGSGTVKFFAPAYSVFVSGVDGVSDITHEGTEVPSDKAEAVRQAAEASNFNLMEG